MGETNHHLNVCFSLELGLIFQRLGVRDRSFFIGGGGMGEKMGGLEILATALKRGVLRWIICY